MRGQHPCEHVLDQWRRDSIGAGADNSRILLRRDGLLVVLFRQAKVISMDYAIFSLLLPLLVFMVYQDWKDARDGNAETNLVFSDLTDILKNSAFK